MTLPINHLKRTLDRCCGQWEFVASDHVPDNRRLTRWSATVRFLNTGIIYDVVWQADRTPQWDSSIVTSLVSSKDDLFIANRLNGHTRDDAGSVADDGDRRVEGEWQIIVNPPPNLILEKGDEYRYDESCQWYQLTDCIGWKVEDFVPVRLDTFELRRRIHDPIYETPDKVVL